MRMFLLILILSETGYAKAARINVPDDLRVESHLQYNLPKSAKKGSGAEETNYYWCRGGINGEAPAGGSFQCTIFRSDGYAVLDGYYVLQRDSDSTPIRAALTQKDIEKIGYDSGGIKSIHLNDDHILKASHVTVFMRDNSELRMEFKDGGLKQIYDVTGPLMK